MNHFITLALGEIETKIEVDERRQEGRQYNGPKFNEVRIQLEEQMKPLLETAKYIVEQMKQVAPDETELSFGIKASGEGGFLGFAKAGAEAQFQVKMTWKASE